MKINIDGREYSFKFYHKNDADTQGKMSDKKNTPTGVFNKKLVPTPIERATTCIIFNEAGVEVNSGTANVHPKDNFCKEKGRQIALSRAISNMDKSYRTQIWEEYRTWGAKDRW